MNIREIDLENVNKIGIYCITNLVNGKKYVGKTGNKKGFIDRWNGHKKSFKNKKHLNCIIYKAFDKYGINNFEFSILETVEYTSDTIKLNKLLNEKEQYWISYYDTYNSNNGYNMTKGGDGLLGYKFTDERRKKYSIRTSDSNNPMYGVRLNKEKNGMYGKHHTKETREKQSQKAIESYNNGRISPTHNNIDIRSKISNSLNNHEVNIKTRNKISESLKNGRRNEKNEIPVVLYDINKVFIRDFNSQKECAMYINNIESTKETSGDIGRHCKNNKSILRKYIVQYK